MRATIFVLEALVFIGCRRRNLRAKSGLKTGSVTLFLSHVAVPFSNERRRWHTPPQHQLATPFEAHHHQLQLCFWLHPKTMLGRDAHNDARSTREVVDFALFLAVITDSFSVESHRCFTPFQHEPMDPFDAPHIQFHSSVWFRSNGRPVSSWRLL